MKRHMRGVLLLIAAALLVAGLAGPVQRAWEARSKAAALQAQAERLASERAALKAEFDANRAQILARIREKSQAGESASAMNSAARYLALDDPELRDLYRKAAMAESLRQRIESYGKTVQIECTEMQVRDQMAHLLMQDDHGKGAHQVPATADGLQLTRLTRLTGAAARDPIRTRLREPPPSEEPLPADADWITRVRAANRARALADFVAGLETPSGDDLVCVWRIEGTRREGGRSVGFTLDLWLSPAPNGKDIQVDPVGYVERRS